MSGIALGLVHLGRCGLKTESASTNMTGGMALVTEYSCTFCSVKVLPRSGSSFDKHDRQNGPREEHSCTFCSVKVDPTPHSMILVCGVVLALLLSHPSNPNPKTTADISVCQSKVALTIMTDGVSSRQNAVAPFPLYRCTLKAKYL